MSAGETLVDLGFRSVVEAYVDRPRFVRRDWLADDIAAQLDDPSCRFVLLTGAPGAGKSAFVAQLAAAHPEWPVYFNRRDQRVQLADGSARSVLLRVGFQLAAAFPELFAIDQVRLVVSQQVGELGGDANLVAAEVDRVVASPFHQIAMDIRQQVSRADGLVVGLRVREWVADPRLNDLADLAAMAILDPARLLLCLRPEDRLVLLIDALDEVTSDPSQLSILDWLARAPEIPPNVRIVLTSRDEDLVAQQLGGHAPATRRLRIGAADPRVRRDLRELAEAMAGSPVVQQALADSNRTARGFVTEAVERADGNIGYLDSVSRAVDAAAADAVRALVTLDRLPADLTELYAFFIRQLQFGPGRRDLRVEDPATGRAALVNVWTELMHPALAVLSVAFEPLSAELVAALTGTVADLAAVRDALRQLSQFLHRTPTGWQLYHASVAAFLVSASATDLGVEAAQTHAAIARRLGRDQATLWQPAGDAVENARRVYARSHYPRHLFHAGAAETLFALLDDGRYGAGKLAADRSGLSYSLDVDLGYAAALADPALEQQLVRAWRYRMLSVILVSPATEPPELMYATLSRLGLTDRAVSLISAIPDPSRRALALAEVAEHSSAGSASPAWLAAVEAAGLIGDDRRRASVLTDVLRRPGVPAAAGVAAAVEDLLPGFDDPEARGEAVAARAHLALAAGDRDGFARAMATLEAMIAAEGAEAVRFRAMQLYLADLDHAAAARVTSASMGYARALQAFRRVEWNGGRSEGFDQAMANMAAVALDEALIPAEKRALARAEMATILSAYGMNDQAATMVEAAVAAAGELGIGALREIGLILAPLDHPVRRIADLIGNAPVDREGMPSTGKLTEISSGPYDDPVYQILPPEQSSFDFAAVVRAGALADLGFPEDILRLAEGREYTNLIEILRTAVTALCARGRIAEALDVADRIGSAEQATITRMWLSTQAVDFMSGVNPADRCRAQIAAAAAEAGAFDQARAIIARLTRKPAQCWALVRLAFHEAGGTDTARAHAAEDIERAFELLRDDAVGGRLGSAAPLVLAILETGQAWRSPRFADGPARWFPDQGDRSDLVETLLRHGQTELARAELARITDFRRCYLLAELAGRTIPEEAATLLAEAEAIARSDTGFPGIRALRRIALAHCRHGAADEAARCLRQAESLIPFAQNPITDYPDERAGLCGDWVEAGSLDGALSLLARLPADDAFSQVFGRCSISREAIRAGLAFDVAPLLTEAENRIAALPWPLAGIASARLAVEWARVGDLDRAVRLAGERVGAVALLLAHSGKAEQAAALFPDPAGMSDDLVGVLIDHAVEAGDLERAVSLAQSRQSPAAMMARVVRRSLAEQLLQPVIDLMPKERLNGQAIWTDLGWAIAGIHGPQTLVSALTDAMGEWSAPDGLLDLLASATALFDGESELAIDLADCLPWLLRAVPAT